MDRIGRIRYSAARIATETLELCRSHLGRVFNRFSWVERMEFELGCLVNLHLGLNGNSDLKTRTDKFALIRAKTLRALKGYRFKTYRMYKSLVFRVPNSKQFAEDLLAAGEIVQGELAAIRKAHAKSERVRWLLGALVGRNGTR